MSAAVSADEATMAGAVLVHPGMTLAEVIAALRMLDPIVHRLTGGAERCAPGLLSEHDVCTALDLHRTGALTEGHDAICPRTGDRYEIKQCILAPGTARPSPGKAVTAFSRNGSTGKAAAAVLLAVYGADRRLVMIRQAPMAAVEAYLGATDSKARQRRRMTATALWSRSRVVWPNEPDTSA